VTVRRLLEPCRWNGFRTSLDQPPPFWTAAGSAGAIVGRAMLDDNPHPSCDR
jgi:hypothetical protein